MPMPEGATAEASLAGALRDQQTTGSWSGARSLPLSDTALDRPPTWHPVISSWTSKIVKAAA